MMFISILQQSIIFSAPGSKKHPIKSSVNTKTVILVNSKFRKQICSINVQSMKNLHFHCIIFIFLKIDLQQLSLLKSEKKGNKTYFA